MSEQFITPSTPMAPTTLGGIKRLAIILKRRDGIQHSLALDQAARYASFQNYKHALHELDSRAPSSSGTPVSALYRVHFTCYWRSRETGQRGLEILSIQLRAPWYALVTRKQLQHLGKTDRMRPLAPDHLECEVLVTGQDEARETVCAAARALHFMDATRLRPSASVARGYPQGDYRKRIPHGDHESVWFDPATRRYLLLDEPYAINESKRRERALWAIGNLQVMAEPAWSGLHHPVADSSTRPVLVTDAFFGIPLGSLVTALDQLGPMPTRDDWPGQSCPESPRFQSPMAGEPIPYQTDKEKAKQPAPGKVVTPPSPSMAFHVEVGALLQTLIGVCRRRSGIRNHLESVRDSLRALLIDSFSESLVTDLDLKRIYGDESRWSEGIARPDSVERTAIRQDIQKLRGLLLHEFAYSAWGGSLARHLGAAEKSLDSWY